ncbi:MAG: DUF1501 domain-containing protein [Planctomycetaceae bacterium]|nr:MAG: DUF1501 domain-containing protein [Planctomycetaceae bacterium]
MWTIDSVGNRTCDGVSRRSFLTVGAMGLGGLTLADLLRADEISRHDAAWSRKSIINVFLSGGPSHMDTFDPKPAAPKEFRGEFKAIDTRVPGVQICEHLPQLADRMDRLAIVRSLTGLYEEHSAHQTETGWSEQSLRSSGGRPSFGSVVARMQGANNGTAPTFVDLTGHTRYGFLGPVYGAFRPDGEGRANLSLAGGVTVGRLDDRTKLLGGLDRLKRDVDAVGSMKAMDAFAERAVSVITSGAVARALDLNREDPRIRQRYLGNGAQPHRENDRFLLARRLISAGVRCVSLSWGGWDTHGDNFGHLRRQLPPFDAGLATLLDDLDAHEILNDTIVIVWGEFGRTPRVNGGAGRDHWPRAASVLLYGGGLQLGQVIGATNRLGEQPTDRPVHLQEIFATLYQHMGIDPRYTTLVDNNGRPQYLVDHNAIVRELVA